MNIKIVICFIIICLIPVSSAATWDNVWVSKYSAFINSSESARINYSLEGEIATLPAASATYRDIRGVTRRATSNTVDTIPLNVLPDEMILFMLSSFLWIAGIISGLALIVYAVTRRGKNHG